MRRIIFVVLALVLSANLAYAGPIAEAVASYQAPAAANRGPNRMLWPGLGLLAGGGAIAIIGFTRVTGADVIVGTNPNLTNVTISANEKHNTALGLAGVGIAALGGFLLMKGEKDRSRTSIVVGPQRVQVSVRF